MKEHGLSKAQLFRLSRRTLEKRIRNFYYKTKDDQATIEMLITLQVRNELCEADFSNVLRALVQHIFLKTRSTAAMRRYYRYFSEYFGAKDWQLLSVKLFPAQTFIAEKLEHVYSQVIKEPLSGLAES
ncbi:hypothetical protein JZO81_04225 [Enterococcus hulanensis]|uniref:hypothetical protein n=1 Tax=Enterococcus TaxID=1350 RepID=UPI000B5A985D|nr:MULTISPECIES: hypothetical protein [Enterococcus]MBO0410244.1 hypothetical protein [Enterococcus hulanensis]OTO14588.1 hypothetical protein A5875_003745 [Enterococcus sp. 3H8_DIV0648]